MGRAVNVGAGVLEGVNVLGGRSVIVGAGVWVGVEEGARYPKLINFGWSWLLNK